MILVQKEVKKVFKGTEQIRPIGTTLPDEDYEFPQGTYPGWTIKTGGFGQGELGSGWIAPSRSNIACVMYRSISGNFKLQHRCAYYNAERGGVSSCGVTTNTAWTSQTTPRTAGTRFSYWSTVSAGYNQGSKIFIDGTALQTTSQLTTGTKYIDEIIYEDGVYTVSLYEDVDGEPGQQLYSSSASSSNAPEVVRVYHEVGTGTASQTNWVKVWYL